MAENIGAVCKERPILFSGSMVKAILAGRKTQTRRIVKPQPQGNEAHWPDDRSCNTWEDIVANPSYYASCSWCPHGGAGDRLWVRETFYCDDYRYPDAPHDELMQAMEYQATHDCADWEAGCPCSDRCWRPSIHMPRWASRITLEITDVRVELLQDISEADAQAEGVKQVPIDTRPGHYNREMFRELWHTIHAADGPNGWEANPWVWAITFRRIESNAAE